MCFILGSSADTITYLSMAVPRTSLKEGCGEQSQPCACPETLIDSGDRFRTSGVQERSMHSVSAAMFMYACVSVLTCLQIVFFSSSWPKA